jgi:hypothetical protein
LAFGQGGAFRGVRARAADCTRAGGSSWAL